MSKIKIYKLDKLTELKGKYNYDDYLIICYGENKGAWYMFQPGEMTDMDMPYLKTNLGIEDPNELHALIQAYNKALRGKSYQELKSKRIRDNKYSKCAETDNGLRLTTKIYKGTAGMHWYKNKGIS